MSTQTLTPCFTDLSCGAPVRAVKALINGRNRGSIPSDPSDLASFEEVAWWIESSLHSRIKAKHLLRSSSEAGHAALVEIDLTTRPSVVFHLGNANHTRERKITTILGAMPVIGDDRQGYVPRVLLVHPSWNAWLSEAYALPFRAGFMTFVHTTSLLTRAVTSLARLQCGAVQEVSRLKRAEAADLTLTNLRRQSLEVFESIGRMWPGPKPSLDGDLSRRKNRGYSLQDLLHFACDAMERLEIPETILHRGLQPQSIAMREHCQFIDWSQSSIGSCVLGLEDLLLLNQGGTVKEREALNRWLRVRYAEEWAKYGGFDLGRLAEAAEYAPFLAAFSSVVQRFGVEQPLPSVPDRSDRRLISHLDRTALQLSMSLVKRRGVNSSVKSGQELYAVA